MSEVPLPYGATRRDFLHGASAALAATTLTGALPAARSPEDPIKLGLVGCGGRGTGATAQALRTKGPIQLVALADLFPDRVSSCLANLSKKDSGVAEKVAVDESRRFSGFDCVDKMLATGVDAVILATPPHFRPAQIEAAVAAGKHVFFEKPVAVDGFGVRQVIAAGEAAQKRNLSLVCGLQRRYQYGYREALRLVQQENAIGKIVAARCYWRGGELWSHPRKKEWSDMEWQLRNWLYFTWLSGDHIVEQHVHNLDVVNWAKGAHPVRCIGIGGRQVRTAPAFGHIYDHHSVHYEYADGSWLFSQCSQMDNTLNEVSEHLIGSDGNAHLSHGGWRIDGKVDWTFKDKGNDPYQTEHDEWMASIRSGKPLNNARYAAESTLTAVMGRRATYTGKVVTWEEALASERLGPSKYDWTEVPVPPVALPGRN